MAKAEIIADILNDVSVVMDVSEENILSKNRRQDVVDARHLAVMLMYRGGICTSGIANIFGMTERNVRHIITTFEARVQLNKQLAKAYDKLRK